MNNYENTNKQKGFELNIVGYLLELSKKICRLLEHGEIGFDEMQAALNADTGALLSALMKLELKMFIELTPEQRYRIMV